MKPCPICNKKMKAEYYDQHRKQIVCGDCVNPPKIRCKEHLFTKEYDDCPRCGTRKPAKRAKLRFKPSKKPA